MKKNWIFIIVVCFCFLMISVDTAWSASPYMQAKIGIQIRSHASVRMAKSRDRLLTGDLLRLFVHPAKASFIYIIHSDKKNVTLLAQKEQEEASYPLILPSTNQYYEVTGTSTFEAITMIISPNPLDSILTLFGSKPTPEEWLAFEKKIIEKSKLELDEESKSGFVIAGNIRGEENIESHETVVKKLRILSGKGIIVKKYEFSIQK